MISLKNRFMLTYTLFVTLILLIITIVINQFIKTMFEEFARSTNQNRIEEIVSIFSEQYNPRMRRFDQMGLSTMGNYFMREGYIVSIESNTGRTLWNARSNNMRHCNMVINDISNRMQRNHQINGSMQHNIYPLMYQENIVGKLSIESYGPFFYSERESRFILYLNRFLFITGLICTVLSILISIILASALTKPILKASNAARLIALGDRDINLYEGYKTRELHELAVSINTLSRELTKGEIRQKQLTSDIAHELRTPLTCLQGNLEAMLDGVLDPTEERLASCYEEIVRLSKLVQDMNLLTTIEWEHLKLQKTSFNLALLMQTIVEQFENSAREKNIVIVQNLIPSEVFADYDRLKQVFINLLSNAVKYTDRGTISVTISHLSEISKWEVCIADTGIGMSVEDLSHVFERFYRSDKSRNRSTGGAGIGLTIAKAIVTAHSGTIEAESEFGKGSIFRVTLPTHPPSVS